VVVLLLFKVEKVSLLCFNNLCCTVSNGAMRGSKGREMCQGSGCGLSLTGMLCMFQLDFLR
jgi:hypothetical protein